MSQSASQLLQQPASLESDDTIAARAQLDTAAFEAIFNRFFDQVYWYCFQLVHDREVAKDATAATFERIFVAISRFDPAKGTFRAWLFRIAHNAAIDQMRKSGKPNEVHLELTDLFPDRQPTLEERYIAVEEERQVLNVLPLLSAGDRQVIELRLAGMNSNEICAFLGRSRSAVDSAQCRAVARIRSLLDVQADRKDHGNVG